MTNQFNHSLLQQGFLCLCVVLLVGCLPGSARAQSGDALIDAAKRGELAEVQALLSQGVDVNGTDKNGKTALMESARTGKNDVVKALIAAKANLDAQDKDGWTAPMRAVTAAQAVTLKTLAEAGANLNLTNNKGKTAYMIAMENGIGDIRPEVITILTNATPATVTDTIKGETPLIYAIKATEPATVHALLKSGADPNSKDNKGVPALVLATAVFDPESGAAMVADLLGAGADVNARDSKNKSALEHAVDVYQGGYDKADSRKQYASIVYTIASFGPDEASVSAARKIASQRSYILFGIMISDGLQKARSVARTESATPTSPIAQSSGAPAVPPKPLGTAKGKPLDTKLFTASLPDGWEVLANDLDSMGMMTLSRKGTGGSHGIYLKFEGNGGWSGTPEEEVASFAKSQKGTTPAKVTMNGIAYVQTAYDAYGTRQTMLVTKKTGTKITLTILGDDYSRSAEVKLFFDTLKLK
jgi:ankyrin repeat protein